VTRRCITCGVRYSRVGLQGEIDSLELARRQRPSTVISRPHEFGVELSCDVVRCARALVAVPEYLQIIGGLGGPRRTRVGALFVAAHFCTHTNTYTTYHTTQ